MATEQSNFSWETVIAIIGALAWVPWIYDKLKPSKLYIKLISNFDNYGQFKQTVGMLHFLKLSISCINKKFNVDNIFIEVKYQNDTKYYKGNIFWARASHWVMDTRGTLKKLVIPHENFLGFVNMFEQDKSDFFYLTFITEKSKLEQFEIIKISFLNTQDRVISIEFKLQDIDSDRILFDDSIWQ